MLDENRQQSVVGIFPVPILFERGEAPASSTVIYKITFRRHPIKVSLGTLQKRASITI